MNNTKKIRKLLKQFREGKLTCQGVILTKYNECINCYLDGNECKIENCPLYQRIPSDRETD